MEDANLFPDKRIEALLNGEAVVVRENRKAGQYVDTIAQWAEDAGLKVYCGRANFHTGHRKSKWLNPYSLQKLGRDEALRLHRETLSDELKDQVGELKGKALSCWCFPEKCREYPKLCVWVLAHAVKTGHLLNRSGYRIANWFRAATHSLTQRPFFSKLRMAR